jgi:alpha-1,6-mannosyltransferase
MKEANTYAALVQKNAETFVLSVVSALAYYFVAYQLKRTDFVELLVLYSFLFLSFVRLLAIHKHRFTLLAILAFSFRSILLFAEPHLSQDFYRFIWDGRILESGINPYLYSPNSIVKNGLATIQDSNFLIDGMGSLSAGNLTNYPPLSQAYFWLCEKLSLGSIIHHICWMRIVLILTDFGILWVGKKLLELLQLKTHTIFWYVLNPFTILEITGNLHFEGLMLFFLVLSLYAYFKKKALLGSVFFSLAVSIKLFPLLLFPVLLKYLGFRQWLLQGIIIAALQIISFLPFASPTLIQNYAETTGLWFQKFEFNASIYYLLREIGYVFRGYNEIAIIGKINIGLFLLFVAYMSLFRKNNTQPKVLQAMLLVLSFFFFTSTTIHPWYLATPLLLSAFTGHRYVLLWTFTVFLSYAAYSQTTFQESYVLLALEYLPVYTLFILEIARNKKPAELNKFQQV